MTTRREMLTGAGAIAASAAILTAGSREAAAQTSNPLPVFNVLDYGADNTASTDSTVAFQSAIDDAKLNGGPLQLGPFNTTAAVVVPPGIYSISSLDLTGLSGLLLTTLNLGQAVLYANRQTTSAPVLDLTGSSTCNLRGLIVAGQNPDGTIPSTLPSTGILLAEMQPGGRSNKNRLDDCGSLGQFRDAPLYIFGDTDSSFYSCAFQQDNPGAPCRVIAGRNVLNTPSPYAPLPTGTVNCGDLTFIGCEWHGAKSTAADTTTLIDTAYAIRNYGGNDDASGGSHFRLRGVVQQLIISGVQIYSELGVAAQRVIDLDPAAVLDGGRIEQTNFSKGFSQGLIGRQTQEAIDIRDLSLDIKSEAVFGPQIHRARGEQVVLGSSDVNLSSAQPTRYLGIGCVDNNPANVVHRVNRRAVVTDMSVRSGGSPGSGSYSFRLIRSGEQAAEVSLSGSLTSAQAFPSASSPLILQPGDDLYVEARAFNGAANTGGVFVSLTLV